MKTGLRYRGSDQAIRDRLKAAATKRERYQAVEEAPLKEKTVSSYQIPSFIEQMAKIYLWQLMLSNLPTAFAADWVRYWGVLTSSGTTFFELSIIPEQDLAKWFFSFDRILRKNPTEQLQLLAGRITPSDDYLSINERCNSTLFDKITDVFKQYTNKYPGMGDFNSRQECAMTLRAPAVQCPDTVSVGLTLEGASPNSELCASFSKNFAAAIHTSPTDSSRNNNLWILIGIIGGLGLLSYLCQKRWFTSTRTIPPNYDSEMDNLIQSIEQAITTLERNGQTQSAQNFRADLASLRQDMQTEHTRLLNACGVHNTEDPVTFTLLTNQPVQTVGIDHHESKHTYEESTLIRHAQTSRTRVLRDPVESFPLATYGPQGQRRIKVRDTLIKNPVRLMVSDDKGQTVSSVGIFSADHVAATHPVTEENIVSQIPVTKCCFKKPVRLKDSLEELLDEQYGELTELKQTIEQAISHPPGVNIDIRPEAKRPSSPYSPRLQFASNTHADTPAVDTPAVDTPLLQPGL